MPFAASAWVFHVGVLLYIINRDEISEMKLPWMVLLFLLPVLGAFSPSAQRDRSPRCP